MSGCLMDYDLGHSKVRAMGLQMVSLMAWMLVLKKAKALM